ncbi:MAG TPA: hypothetical protein VIN66_04315 [Rheinheimera sp.]|uniref:hypothetical protein n=1 Tax=Rheinheimera sp. TaxID=1869214 RepID=UPI002F92FB33
MKKILAVVLLVSACGTSATNYPYLGCQWFIPAEFKKISDNEFRRLPSANEPERSFSSVMFTSVTPQHLDTYVELEKLADTEVLVISHPATSDLSFKSLFVNRKTRLGSTLKSDTLLVSKDGLAVSMLDVTPTDSLHMTSACVPAQVVEQHYAVQQQLEQGIKLFLETDHGLSILVPAQN